MTMLNKFPGGAGKITIEYGVTTDTIYVPIVVGSEYKFDNMASVQFAPSSLVYPKDPTETGYVVLLKGSMLMGNAEMVVRVLSADDEPLNNVMVAMIGASEYDVTTDSDGLATAGIPPGAYTLRGGITSRIIDQPVSTTITCNCNNAYEVTLQYDVATWSYWADRTWGDVAEETW